MSTRIPTTQERMLDLLSNGHNRFMVGISSNRFTASVRQIHQIFNDKFKAYQEEGGERAVDPPQGKISVVMWKCWMRPMMSFAI